MKSKKQKISDDKNELLTCALKERILQFHEIKMSIIYLNAQFLVHCTFIVGSIHLRIPNDWLENVMLAYVLVYFGVSLQPFLFKALDIQ